MTHEMLLLINVLVVLIVCSLLWKLVELFTSKPFLKLAQGVVILIAIVWLLSLVFHGPMPRFSLVPSTSPPMQVAA
jgi:DNA integrity scanning protein DisA with diadenylate cyclase activity